MDHLLNVLIALTLTLALFSLAVTAIVEAAASAFQMRARTLKQALKVLLDEAEGSGLFRPLYEGSHIGGIARESSPSYIAPQEFAKALLGQVRKGLDADPFADFARSLDTLPDGRLKQTLHALALDAEGDVDRLKANVATWFDTAMARLSGSYKRMSQIVSFAVALGLAVALNADLVHMGQTLAGNPQLAQEEADRAAGVLEERAAAAALPSPSDAAAMAALQDRLEDAEARIAKMQATPLIGYKCETKGDRFCPEELGAERIGLSVLGWLLMAITALAGAPFWFDVLQRFVNLRGTGPKPGTRTPGDGS